MRSTTTRQHALHDHCNHVTATTNSNSTAYSLTLCIPTPEDMQDMGGLLSIHTQRGDILCLDGDLGAHVRKEISKANLVAMDNIWDNGFRQITSSTKPIQTADDLKGFKIRVPVSPMWTSMFKAFDSAPASINFAEVYSALQTKVVDGQENPLAIIDTAKLNEVQKYCSVTNHMWDGFWFLANRRAWDRLPADLRTIVAKHINAAGLKQRADVAAMNATLQKSLTEKGMVFNNAKADTFRNRLRQAGFYTEWKAKFGDEAWALLERYSGKLG